LLTHRQTEKTNKQTNKVWQKHNLLGKGNNSNNPDSISTNFGTRTRHSVSKKYCWGYLKMQQRFDLKQYMSIIW